MHAQLDSNLPLYSLPCHDKNLIGPDAPYSVFRSVEENAALLKNPPPEKLSIVHALKCCIKMQKLSFWYAILSSYYSYLWIYICLLLQNKVNLLPESTETSLKASQNLPKHQVRKRKKHPSHGTNSVTVVFKNAKEISLRHNQSVSEKIPWNSLQMLFY